MSVTLPAMLEGSADPKAVVRDLRKQDLLKLYPHARGERVVMELTWGHVPGYGRGPAIVIPVDKVTEEAEAKKN